MKKEAVIFIKITSNLPSETCGWRALSPNWVTKVGTANGLQPPNKGHKINSFLKHMRVTLKGGQNEK